MVFLSIKISLEFHYFLATEGSLVNKVDLQALFLSGPCVTGPVQDPLAVKCLHNRLYISTFVILLLYSDIMCTPFIGMLVKPLKICPLK